MTTAISEIVSEIESNKNRAADIADELRARDGVEKAENYAGRLRVAVSDTDEIQRIASEYAVDLSETCRAGSRFRPDEATCEHTNAVFTL